MTHDLLGYLTDDLGEARAHRAAACEAASEAGHAPLIAQVLVGSRTWHCAATSTSRPRRRLGDARFAEAAREGTRTSWSQLVEVTLAS